MSHIQKHLVLWAVSGFICAAGLTACDKSESTDAQTPSSAHDDHDGHDHGTGGAAGEVGHHDNLEMRSLGQLEISGVMLEASLAGDVMPGGEAHVEIRRVSGPAPAALRFWIGDEAATGAVKVKADSHDDHYHGETAIPTELGGIASLWIEIELSDGTRRRGQIALK